MLSYGVIYLYFYLLRLARNQGYFAKKKVKMLYDVQLRPRVDSVYNIENNI